MKPTTSKALIFAIFSVCTSASYAQNPRDSLSLRSLPQGLSDPSEEWDIFRDASAENVFYFAPKKVYRKHLRPELKADAVGTCEMAQLFDEKITSIFQRSVELSQDGSAISRMIQEKLDLSLQRLEAERDLARLNRNPVAENTAVVELTEKIQKLIGEEEKIKTIIDSALSEKDHTEGRALIDDLSELDAQREILRRWVASLSVEFFLPDFRPKDQEWRKRFQLSDRAIVRLAPYVDLLLSPTNDPTKPDATWQLARWRNSFGAGDLEWSLIARPIQGVISSNKEFTPDERYLLQEWYLPSRFTYQRELSLMEYCRINREGDAETFQIQYGITLFEDDVAMAPIGSTILEHKTQISRNEAAVFAQLSQLIDPTREGRSIDYGHPLRFSGQGKFVRRSIDLEIIDLKEKK